MGTQQQFCLRWNNHQTNMLNVFDHLLQNETLVDVTLACEGISLRAHKVVLSACSPYFQALFVENPCKHPIVILRDVAYFELKALIEFMYKGEVNVSQDKLPSLLKTAEYLKVKGLSDVSHNNQSSEAAETVMTATNNKHAATILAKESPSPPPPAPPPPTQQVAQSPPPLPTTDAGSPVAKRKKTRHHSRPSEGGMSSISDNEDCESLNLKGSPEVVESRVDLPQNLGEDGLEEAPRNVDEEDDDDAKVFSPSPVETKDNILHQSSPPHCFSVAPHCSETKRKRVVLSISDKLKIIEKIEVGGTIANIAAEYGIGVTTVKDLKKKKECLKKYALQLDLAAKESILSSRKTLKMSNDKTLEEAVYQWYCQQRSAGVPVRGSEILAAAERLAKHLKIENFNASSGWLYRFRNRHGIVDKCNQSEFVSADTANCESFGKMLHELIGSADFMLSQIYNASGTRIFWRFLPNNTRASEHEIVTRGMKDRFSALLCANADGSHRHKSIVVGNSEQFQALKDCNHQHYSSSNSWLTQDILRDWFYHHFDPDTRWYQTEVLKIAPEAVKAVLILDNGLLQDCCENLFSRDGKIRCIALPPNSSSPIQSLNQGIAIATKRLYRKKYLHQVMVEEAADNVDKTTDVKVFDRIKNYTMKSAVSNWGNAWNEIDHSILTNGWKKFIHGIDHEFDLKGFQPSDYLKIFAAAGEKNVTIEDIAAWLYLDESDPGCHPDLEILTEDEIISRALAPAHKHSEDVEMGEELQEDNAATVSVEMHSVVQDRSVH